VNSIFLLPDQIKELIYSDDAVARIQRITNNDGAAYSREAILASPECFREVGSVFSGWGSPVLDAELLDALPNLKAYFYGAGSVRAFVTEEFWKRDILLTSSYKANAVPVAEFTVAMVNLSLKQVWSMNRGIRSGENSFDRSQIPGMYHGSTVGIISLGAIGQRVCRKLIDLHVEVVAFDPYADESIFESCGARPTDSLESLFSSCDVVSLHTPWLPETENLITGDHFRAMREGATFINTSRGMVVDEAAMLRVLRERPNVFAVLDVVQDESQYGDNPLGKLSNVFLTPHIAGSMGRECHRMGNLAVEECERFLRGDPPITPITRESAKRLA